TCRRCGVAFCLDRNDGHHWRTNRRLAPLRRAVRKKRSGIRVWLGWSSNGIRREAGPNPFLCLARHDFSSRLDDLQSCSFRAARVKNSFAAEMSARIHPLARFIAALARGISGVQIRWQGCVPEPRQRIYFANHTSHLDFVVLWSALPVELRAQTRPVAAKDYWPSGFRSFLAQKVFRAVLVERGAVAARSARDERPDEEPSHAKGFAVIEQLAEAMGAGDSLIFFPEGTRGTGETVGEFKSGLYHLAK